MVIMDMDPGIDDAIALILALRTCKIDAITTVCGNVDVKQCSINALKILEALNYDIPVYIGASKPLKRDAYFAKDIHGSDGLGNSNLADPKKRAKPIDMLDLNNHDIIATGPLTNLINANARLYIMGGIYDYNQQGNASRYAEFNFYVDPEAASIVLKDKHIVASGLDLTTNRSCSINHDFLDKLYNINSKYASLAYKLLRYPVNKFKYFNLHDVFALFSYIKPDIFEYKRFKVRMDDKIRGRCIFEEHASGNVKVCKYVDDEAFNRLLIELLK